MFCDGGEESFSGFSWISQLYAEAARNPQESCSPFEIPESSINQEDLFEQEATSQPREVIEPALAPSLSTASDSWIEECYGAQAEASSSFPDDRGPRQQAEGALFQPPRVAEQAAPYQAAPHESSSTSFPKLEWEKALDLPDGEPAPKCLQVHLEKELRILLNIGKKRTLN